MRLSMICLYIFSCLAACTHTPKDQDTEPNKQIDSSPSNPFLFQLGHTDWAETASRQLRLFSENKIEEMALLFSDSLHYGWNNGDSFDGKEWTVNYLRHRRNKLIDTIYYTDQFWMPIDIKEPSYKGQITGPYVFGWMTLHATYSSGKSVEQRIHLEYHFDKQNRIDRITQFTDRLPITQAGGE